MPKPAGAYDRVLDSQGFCGIFRCMTQPKKFIGRKTHYLDFARNLKDGDVRHGLSDGSWPFMRLIEVVAQQMDRPNMGLAVWTAYGNDIEKLYRLSKKNLGKVSILLDRSFPSRRPESSKKMRELFGDDKIRMWNCHAKFCLLTGGGFDALILTSANLNKCIRVENFTIWCDHEMVWQYHTIIEDVFELQRETDCFTSKSVGVGRSTANQVLNASNPRIKRKSFGGIAMPEAGDYRI